MGFMNTKHAVQTCVLSRRWKNLWKFVPNLTLHSSDFWRLPIFNKFMSSFMSCQDDSVSLPKLSLQRQGLIKPKLPNLVMKHAVLHNVQQLKIDVIINFKLDFEFPPCLFSSRSLKFLDLSVWSVTRPTKLPKLPKSLELPMLETLHLLNVAFTASDNDCAEPFSACNMLNTLVIDSFDLEHDAQVLSISNAKLSNLTIGKALKVIYKIVLYTPSLSFLTITGEPQYQFSSSCNLSFLEEVNIDTRPYTNFPGKDLAIFSWLQVIANVKITTLSLSTLELLYDFLIHAEPPSFCRLKTLKVTINMYSDITYEAKRRRAVDYLLRNSPLASINIIYC